jgi:hypothetical protein
MIYYKHKENESALNVAEVATGINVCSSTLISDLIERHAYA